MKINGAHLTYCSNIHPGINWNAHFEELKNNLPYIKEGIAPNQSLALGLRLANQASLELEDATALADFKDWLKQNDIYVFTMNGFPYGDFHGTFVKDHVHTPDWTTDERYEYTLRLFNILVELLPEGMHGGVSTPPLSYRHWWETPEELEAAKFKATINILHLVQDLIHIKKTKGISLHLDIEPEPDGILDNGDDFFNWYKYVLIPLGASYLHDQLGYSVEESKAALFEHVQLCYDVCHFAVSYESPEEIVEQLNASGIQVGKIQISSALQVLLGTDAKQKLETLKTFDEPTYLHQVVARTNSGELEHYKDLGEAFAAYTSEHEEWRVHFHVPLFIDSYGLLNSTQMEIVKTLALHKKSPISPYLEIETYTWGVLPDTMQKPIADSILRELQWVKNELEA